MNSNTARPRLTVAILALESAPGLPETIRSLAAVADEMLVMHPGAEPIGIDMAAFPNVRVVEQPWNQDFAEVRNAGMAAASGDYILWVENGETMPSGEAQAMRQFIDERANPRTVYLLYSELKSRDPRGSAERIAQFRLLPNIPKLRFAGRVQEHPRTAILELGLQVELLPLSLQRPLEDHDPKIRQARAIRNLQLLKLEINQRGRLAGLLNALGEALATLDDPQAAACFQEAIWSAARGSTDMLEAYYGLLNSFGPEQHKQQLAVCVQALEHFPMDAQLLCAMGTYLQAQQHWELASRSFGSAVKFGQVNPETWHLCEIGEVAATCLATTWQLQGNSEKAAEALEEALQRMPNSLRLRRMQIEVHVTQGNLLHALAHAERLPKDFPLREAFRSAIRGGCQAVRGNWIPALAYLETAYTAGCRESLCLRYYTLALMSAGRRDDCLAVLREWRANEPNNPEIDSYLAELNSDSQETIQAAARLRVDQPDGRREPVAGRLHATQAEASHDARTRQP